MIDSSCFDTVWTTLITLCKGGTSTTWPGYARSGIIYIAFAFVLSLAQVGVTAALAHNFLTIIYICGSVEEGWDEVKRLHKFPMNIYLDSAHWDEDHGFTVNLKPGTQHVIWIEIIMPLVALLLTALQLIRHWRRTVTNRDGLLTGVLGLVVWLIFPYAAYSLRIDPKRKLDDVDSEGHCFAKDYWKLLRARQQRIGLGKTEIVLAALVCFFFVLYMSAATHAAYLNRKTTQIHTSRATELQNRPDPTVTSCNDNTNENTDLPVPNTRDESTDAPRNPGFNIDVSPFGRNRVEEDAEAYQSHFADPVEPRRMV